MRLTEKSKQGYIYKAPCPDGLGFVIYEEYPIQKLGQLEDIEDKFGIDLLLKDKAEQAKKLYCKYGENNEIIDTNYAGSYKDEAIILYVPYKENCPALCHYPWKDYGKTWALTKEELL